MLCHRHPMAARPVPPAGATLPYPRHVRHLVLPEWNGPGILRPDPCDGAVLPTQHEAPALVPAHRGSSRSPTCLRGLARTLSCRSCPDNAHARGHQAFGRKRLCRPPSGPRGRQPGARAQRFPGSAGGLALPATAQAARPCAHSPPRRSTHSHANNSDSALRASLVSASPRASSWRTWRRLSQWKSAPISCASPTSTTE